MASGFSLNCFFQVFHMVAASPSPCAQTVLHIWPSLTVLEMFIWSIADCTLTAFLLSAETLLTVESSLHAALPRWGTQCWGVLVFLSQKCSSVGIKSRIWSHVHLILPRGLRGFVVSTYLSRNVSTKEYFGLCRSCTLIVLVPLILSYFFINNSLKTTGMHLCQGLRIYYNSRRTHAIPTYICMPQFPLFFAQKSHLNKVFIYSCLKIHPHCLYTYFLYLF